MAAHMEISESLIGEADFFIVSLACGVALRLGYDVFLILRRYIRHGTFLVNAEDALYCAVCACLIFYMLYRVNQGVPRVFCLMAVAAGMGIYHFGPGTWVIRIIFKILDTILRPAKTVKKIFSEICRKLLKY